MNSFIVKIAFGQYLLWKPGCVRNRVWGFPTWRHFAYSGKAISLPAHGFWQRRLVGLGVLLREARTDNAPEYTWSHTECSLLWCCALRLSLDRGTMFSAGWRTLLWLEGQIPYWVCHLNFIVIRVFDRHCPAFIRHETFPRILAVVSRKIVSTDDWDKSEWRNVGRTGWNWIFFFIAVTEIEGLICWTAPESRAMGCF